MTIDIIKIFSLTVFASLIAVLLTPFLTNFLYKHKMWRKSARTKTITGDEAPVFYSLHKEKEVNTPRFGGILIWGVTSLVILLFFILPKIFDSALLEKLNFLSRGQTWLPLFTLVSASLLGLSDDILQVFGKGKYVAGGMRFTRRLLVVAIIGTIGALWFYFKLEWSTIHIPLIGDIVIGFWYIPLFIITMIACWAGGVVDGLDGLGGGTFASIFAGFSIIALFRGQADLAIFCAVITGTILAFLWFNIPPARFYMG